MTTETPKPETALPTVETPEQAAHRILKEWGADPDSSLWKGDIETLRDSIVGRSFCWDNRSLPGQTRTQDSVLQEKERRTIEMTKPEYTIAKGMDECDLTARVNELMREGWKPQGGVTHDGFRFFLQTMVRGGDE